MFSFAAAWRNKDVYKTVSDRSGTLPHFKNSRRNANLQIYSFIKSYLAYARHEKLCTAVCYSQAPRAQAMHTVELISLAQIQTLNTI